MRLYFHEIFPFIGDMLLGLRYSVILTLISMSAGLVIGFVACLCKMSHSRPLKVISKCYIEVIRNTPLLVQLYILYFGLSEFSVDLSPFAASSIAMVINAGAYIAEILRGGFLSVPAGLVEAGASLGMKPYQILRYISLKLVMKSSFPGLINQFILMFLFSSVTSTIAMNELTYVTFNLQSSTARVFEVLFLSGAMYYIVSIISVAILKKFGKHVFAWK